MAEELKKLALQLAKDGPVKVMPTPRLTRLLHNGIIFIKTTAASYVWEHPYYPHLYIPYSVLNEAAKSDPENVTLKEIETINHEGNEIAKLLSLQVGKKTPPITKILSFASSPSIPSAAKDLAGLVKIDFQSIDKWFEEDSPIFVHPKDPFKRISILPSSRHVSVSLDDTILAETASSMHLYETGLPPRYYLPFASLVHPEDLIPSATKTQCPYKGVAGYYSVRRRGPTRPDDTDVESAGRGRGGEGEVANDIIWYYDIPTPESAGIMGLICFYNEKVDVRIDGVLQERPVTHMATGPDSRPPLF